jgi:hypothetical protein
MGKSNRAVRPDGAILTRFQYRVLCAIADSVDWKDKLIDRQEFLSRAAYRLPWKQKPASPWMRFSQQCGLLVVAGLATKKKAKKKVATYELTEYGINVLLNDHWIYEHVHS